VLTLCSTPPLIPAYSSQSSDFDQTLAGAGLSVLEKGREYGFLNRGSAVHKTCERGGSGWLDSLFPFLSGASRVADYAAVSRVVRLS